MKLHNALKDNHRLATAWWLKQRKKRIKLKVVYLPPSVQEKEKVNAVLLMTPSAAMPADEDDTGKGKEEPSEIFASSAQEVAQLLFPARKAYWWFIIVVVPGFYFDVGAWRWFIILQMDSCGQKVSINVFVNAMNLWLRTWPIISTSDIHTHARNPHDWPSSSARWTHSRVEWLVYRS